MSKYDDLVKKLKEIFQIDKPELNFGVYKILGAKVAEISDYLDKGLSSNVDRYLNSARTQELENIKKELEEKEAQYREDGIDPTKVPKLNELRALIASGDGVESANAVFSNLLTFFSRYYIDGDFVTQRRYKGDTYSIPYSGEEVLLHWVNKDQYYTKSGENFTNYSFKLDDGRSVIFKLVAADTAKDNRKEIGKDRRFMLIEERDREVESEDGDKYIETLKPIEEVEINGVSTLVLRFEYKTIEKGFLNKQDEIVAADCTKILNDSLVKARWLDLAKREPTEKNPKRTLLERCLASFTSKNTSDYFIHKDLGKFLESELDFYIKNEILILDDIQNSKNSSQLQSKLNLIQAFRLIAKDLIKFLSQLEDFQKKIWLKKRFVVSTNYCLTLDLIPRSLYRDILDNPRQIKQWSEYGMLGATSKDLLNSGSVDMDFLETHQSLMVDTALFDTNFKYKILANIDDLDAAINGTLINADNFQALNLLRQKFKNQIKCVHIDPPYNTATSGFLYKNQFQHSSWLSMMSQTTSQVPHFLSPDGTFQCHIDENEYENLFLLMESLSLPNSGTVIWDKKNPMLGRKGVATQHEYVLWRSNVDGPIYLKNDNVVLILNKAKNLISDNGGVNEQSRQAFSKWITAQDSLTGGEKAYRFIDDNGAVYRGVAMGAPEPRLDPKFHIPLIHPITNLPCPVPPNGWSRTPETLKALIDDGQILWGKDHTSQPQKKVYMGMESKRQLSSVIQNANSGKRYMDALGLAFPYCHPVSLYTDLFGAVPARDGDIFLDYFAGSGTTGHAVIDLNRQDGINRKYVLVEQGEYFEDVTKPRIQKVVYSSEWSNGQAKSNEGGLSHMFKVLKLESFEDSLNNIELKSTPEKQKILEGLGKKVREDYLLNYFLDIESSGSILSVDKFNKPFEFKLNVSMDSSGASTEVAIDLVETFNYLIGLSVKHLDAHLDRGYLTISGTMPGGEKALVIWRDTEKLPYEKLSDSLKSLSINPADDEFSVVYINGDHNLPTTFTPLETEGGITKTLKIKQIESEFLSQMFSTENI